MPREPNPDQSKFEDQNSAEAPEQLFTVEEIAGLANVSVKTVRRWIETEFLGCHRLGRIVRVSDRHYRDMLSRDGVKRWPKTYGKAK
jgi:excisionase family DNA binding protein